MESDTNFFIVYMVSNVQKRECEYRVPLNTFFFKNCPHHCMFIHTCTYTVHTMYIHCTYNVNVHTMYSGEIFLCRRTGKHEVHVHVGVGS